MWCSVGIWSLDTLSVCMSSVRALFRVKWSRVFNESLLEVEACFGDVYYLPDVLAIKVL
jgi:hypothetical protein